MSMNETPYPIDDGLKHIPNRFEAIICCAQRARELRKKDMDSDYMTLTLKELAAGKIDRAEYIMKAIVEQSKKGEPNGKRSHSKQSR